MSGRLSVPEHFGMVATLVRGEEVATIHKPGTPLFALRAIVRACDRYGWKVRCLSSPVTVYRDLQGTRSRSMYGGEMNREEVAAFIQNPEREMLGKLGRRDLLA